MAMIDRVRGTRTFIEESWEELQKVTWPDWPQLKNATIVIIVFVILISAVIWLMDVVVRFVIDSILRLFGA
jgi:preprotein translocase subunit SecE